MHDTASYAGVHILNAPYQIDREYTYSVPPSLTEKISVGSVVIVPFGGGNRHVGAVVSSLKDSCELAKTKPVLATVSEDIGMGEELFGICAFMKERFFCSIGDAAKTVLPSGFSVRTGVSYKAVDGMDLSSLSQSSKAIVEHLAEQGEETESALKSKFGKSAASLSALASKGYVERITSADCKINTKSDRYVKLLLSEEEQHAIFEERKSIFTPKQKSAIAELIKNPLTPVDELCELSGVGESVIRELTKKGAAEIVKIDVDRNPYSKILPTDKQDFTLSDAQKKAFEALVSLYRDNEPHGALLHGVTGSGKTNVTEALVDVCVSEGKSAIVLVPEIALTSQAVGIFVGRYGDKVAVLHSGLSAGERLDAWKRVKSGEAKIVLGTRSAIFAPCKNLGLIVIDEEQESSFKSDMTPRYHARDIARYRCAKSGALMLLCSATPSIESYYKAKNGTYTLVELTERYGDAKLPQVEICDMRDNPGQFPAPEKIEGSSSQRLVCDKLLSEIEKNTDAGNQSVLFINRRGYKSHLSCHMCGFVLECPNCSVSMTYHKYGYGMGGKMVCHYCGHTCSLPEKCPVCDSTHLSTLGTGTQMLDEQLGEYFPKAKILRMDADTTTGKFSHDAILEKFRKREADVLLGTQMVTKGHDFEGVTLVGVINADASLHLPDFRANEKTFSLLTQVIGRAGRGENPGRAYIQSYSPDHEVLHFAMRQDYKAFFQSEIAFRRAALYPPFCDIITVNFTSDTDSDVRLATSAFSSALDKALTGEYKDVKMVVFGPFEAGIYKIAGKYRMRFVLKCRNNTRTRQLLAELYKEFLEKTTTDVSVSIDTDPQNI